jgi:predicted nucleic acid-binding protein
VIVLDASAVVELLLQTDTGVALGRRLLQVEETLHAPHLLDIEVTQVIRRFVLSGAVDEDRGSAALRDLMDLDVTRHPHDVLLPRVWQLHRNLTAYDASYVALAEALGAVLLTTDGRLAKSSGHDAKIDVLRALDA